MREALRERHDSAGRVCLTVFRQVFCDILSFNPSIIKVYNIFETLAVCLQYIMPGILPSIEKSSYFNVYLMWSTFKSNMQYVKWQFNVCTGYSFSMQLQLTGTEAFKIKKKDAKA